jgi:hypothetical protein
MHTANKQRPAEDVDVGLTEEQIRYYRTFGFLKFPGLFAAEIGAITDAFEEVWAASGRTHDHVKRSSLVPFIDQHPYLSGLLDDPRIDELATTLLGEDYNYEASDGNYYVGDTKWHSDKEPDDSHPSFKIAFYLDPVTASTGCLRVIPGSIFGGDPFATALHDVIPFTMDSHPERWGVSGAEVPAYPIESVPGDMLLFNHKIKHSSWGGGDRRRMFTLNMQARFPEADLPALREEIRGLMTADVTVQTGRAYGPAMLQTAGPKRMRHLEQRLANDEVLRT